MIQDTIRTILAEHSKLPVDIATIGDDSDLYSVGLTSLTTVNIMLAVEDHFDIEFEDNMLSRQTFQSIAALSEAVQTLINEQGGG